MGTSKAKIQPALTAADAAGADGPWYSPRRMPPATHAASRELFRYARLAPPRILDLRARAAAYRDTPLAADTAEPGQLQEWAQAFAQSEEHASGFGDLGLRVFDYLKIDSVPDDRLPDKTVVADAVGLAAYLGAERDRIARAQRRLTLSLLASTIRADAVAAARQSRALQFLEWLPHLASMTRSPAYAPAVLNRYRRPAERRLQAKAAPIMQAAPAALPAAPGDREVLNLWDIANEYSRWRKRALTNAIEATRKRPFTSEAAPLAKVKAAPKASKAAASKKSRKLADEEGRAERSREYRAYLREKVETLQELQREHDSITTATPYQRVAALKDDREFKDYIARKYGDGIVDTIGMAKPPTGKIGTFCEWYETTATPAPLPASGGGCVEPALDPCLQKFVDATPTVDGADDVRPLGVAELVTVEERWLAYQPGEISAVETVIKGETRKRTVKSAKYFEEATERMTSEIEDRESETQSTVKQDLSSQIETELASRFESNLNASAQGSGGGTIGVVNLEGGASLGADVALGLDSRMSDTSESKFSQEIVSKAVERTKRATAEVRRTRTYQLYETKDVHGIDNTGADASNNNAIYCYLDKQICITERVYGLRKFLGAEIVRPGADLLEKERRKRLLNLNEIGLPPVFDLRPNDISPENYLSLVGRLRASNVSPPPAGVRMVSKTYKTDLTNENSEPNEINLKKIADVLTPFFGKYKRFLIQDQIEIPEGYRVQEVRVTITHGSNGVSIPAHLPFSLLGAAIYALPTVGVAAVPPYTLVYLPMAIWQVLYAASPFLHYNADSSNVTVNVGHQAEQSPYFFFEPDFLIREIIDAIGNSSIVTADFIAFLRDQLVELYDAFTSTSNNGVVTALFGLTDEMKDAINTFISELQTWLGNLVTTVIPSMITGGSGSGPSLPQIPSLPADIVRAIPEAILAPFRRFFDALVRHIEGLLQDSLGDLFQYFMTMTSSIDTRVFTGVKGFTGSLPVSFNCIALKPGVTVNLSACMVRIDDQALDAWRLETFSRLNQAYYQLVADYEGRRGARVQPPRRESPGLMRIEEHETIKARVMAALHHKYSAAPGSTPTLDELRLYEHAIDWENLSFRVFGYGANAAQVAYEKLGLFDGADERRRQIMNALWSQVLIPLREDERFEQVLLRYLETGVVDFEADLLAALDDGNGVPLDELTAIYRDLVLQRQRLPDVPPVSRQEVVPTDLMIIYEPGAGQPYPVNPAGCG